MSFSTNEQAFRCNNRKMTDGDRFDIVVRQIIGKRLTWDQLTGKSEEPRRDTQQA
jgi:hypothetical protein